MGYQRQSGSAFCYLNFLLILKSKSSVCYRRQIFHLLIFLYSFHCPDINQVPLQGEGEDKRKDLARRRLPAPAGRLRVLLGRAEEEARPAEGEADGANKRERFHAHEDE